MDGVRIPTDEDLARTIQTGMSMGLALLSELLSDSTEESMALQAQGILALRAITDDPLVRESLVSVGKVCLAGADPNVVAHVTTRAFITMLKVDSRAIRESLEDLPDLLEQIEQARTEGKDES